MPGHPRIAILAISDNFYPSYASVADADRRLAVDPAREALWSKTPDNMARSYDDKAKFLVAATNRIDMEAFVGKKSNVALNEDGTVNAGFDASSYFAGYDTEYANPDVDPSASTPLTYPLTIDGQSITNGVSLAQATLQDERRRQVNEWPRTGAAPRRTVDEMLRTPAMDEVPHDIYEATILLAGSLAVTSAEASPKYEGLVGDKGSNIRAVKAGDSQVTYFRNSASYRPRLSLRYIYPDIYEILRPWLVRGYRESPPGGQAFGTDGRSYFQSPHFEVDSPGGDVNIESTVINNP